MDFLLDPHKKSLYEKSKHTVRKWEINFKKNKGRQPSKLDIREASSDVRNAYKLYFRLKTAALEESLTDIEGFHSEVEIVENVPTASDETVPETDLTWGPHLNKVVESHESEKPEKLSVNLSFTKKLFENGKTRKLPRKSLSFVRKKSQNEEKPRFFSQPECVEELDLSVLPVKIVNTTPVVSTQSINLIQSMVESGLGAVRQVDKQWVQRALNEQRLNDGIDDDVIANSEDELDNSCSVVQIAKKHKPAGVACLPEENSRCELQTVDTTSKRLDFSNLFSSTSQASVPDKAKPRKSTRKTTKKTYVDDEEQITEDVKTTEEKQTYELEYSVKSRIVSVPRFASLKTAIKNNAEKSKVCEDETLTKREEKLAKKLESGSANDNFVRINLKKKIYARGKSGKSFSTYKKQMWKKNMIALYGSDMCDSGTLTCFNCGKTGHFARQCPSSKTDSLLPLDDDEEDDGAIPTLEEAAKIARESALAVRPPLRADKKVDSTSDWEFDDDCDEELVAVTRRLEEEIAKLDVQKYMDTTTHVKPYYPLKEDGSLIDTPQEVYDALQQFGHTEFRPGQEVAIMRILSGKSTLVTLSTGTGKSLCYQLPAYLYSQREPCISLIISPLVSLMEDQVTGLPAFLKAACLHTNQTKVQREKVMESIKAGNLSILLVSPEAVAAGEKSTGFGSLLRQLPPIAFACIDEAHCVSQWSHNFRPSYLKICRILRERLSVNAVLGLTATATRSTSDSIISQLSIPDGREGIISDVPLPDNLTLTVSKDANRDLALLSLLTSDSFKQFKSIIVYCTRRETCQRVAAFLRTSLKNDGISDENPKKRKRYSVQAEPYHAGMSASKRKSIQKAFMSGQLRIVVATVAFGMGINKADIRAIIHYNMPMSFECYVQEIGRAGRDGLPAHCHLFLDFEGKDEDELRRHIYANTIDRHVIRKLLQRCFVPCSCTGTCPKHEVVFSIVDTVQALDIPEENVETLLCYLELHAKAYVQLLNHVYITCKIISYNGPNEIKKAARDCPPLAMALALHKHDDQKNIFEFPVVEVASAMGWDSGICKHKLKNLEWITVNGQPKRSRLSVQFSNLGFHLMTPGNLPASALDEALDELYAHVQEQQNVSLLQLHAIADTLTRVAKTSFRACVETDDCLKTTIREYFENPNPLKGLPELPTRPVDEDRVQKDTRILVSMYRDNAFTGRAVARIFHGIQSPNYPAFIWGKCKFWRSHLGTDFNSICLIATREILRMRDVGLI